MDFDRLGAWRGSIARCAASVVGAGNKETRPGAVGRQYCMQAVDLEHATLTGGKFRRTNLHNVINLDDRAQLAGVSGDSMTIETLSPPHTMDKCP